MPHTEGLGHTGEAQDEQVKIQCAKLIPTLLSHVA